MTGLIPLAGYQERVADAGSGSPQFRGCGRTFRDGLDGSELRAELQPVMIQTWPSSRDRRQDWPGKITGKGDRRSSHVTRSALAGDLARL